jgi:hypothetical protein
MHNESETTDESLRDDPDTSGRPKSTAKEREQRRLYMKSWRRKTSDPRTKQEAEWAANWSALSDSEREALTAKQEDCGMFAWLMGKVARCVIRKDFETIERYQPDTLNEVIESWIAEGNFLVGPYIPRQMAHLPELQDMFSDDPEFKLYGIRVHLSDMAYECFEENLRKYRRHKAGESTVPVNASYVQSTGLTLTEKQEAALVESEIRKSVLGR